MIDVLFAAWASGALFFDFPLGTLRASGDFFVLVLETLGSYPPSQALIDGRRRLVVAGCRFGRGRPHAGPVVLDDNDLGVEDPGQY